MSEIEKQLDQIEADVRQRVLEAEAKEQVPRPSPGRIVWYQSRTGNYFLPAIISVTRINLFPGGVEAGHIPDLSSDTNVHLIVFSPGPGGLRASATDFQVESEHGRAENEGGTYAEWDIPYDPDGGPGTWRWPTRS